MQEGLSITKAIRRIKIVAIIGLASTAPFGLFALFNFIYGIRDSIVIISLLPAIGSALSLMILLMVKKIGKNPSISNPKKGFWEALSLSNFAVMSLPIILCSPVFHGLYAIMNPSPRYFENVYWAVILAAFLQLVGILFSLIPLYFATRYLVNYRSNCGDGGSSPP